MGNVRIARNFREAEALSHNAHNANFSTDNMLDISSPLKSFRTDTAAGVYVSIDLKKKITDLVELYMDWCNFKNCRIGVSSNRATWRYLTCKLEADPSHGVYRTRYEVEMNDERYISIRVNSTESKTDGANYFQIGTVCLPTDIVELDADIDVVYPYSVTLPSPHIVENRFPSGRVEKTRLTTLPPMQFSVGINALSEQNISGDKVRQVMDLLRDPASIFYLDFNMGNSWQAYLVRRAGDLQATVSLPNTGTVDFGTILFEVVT